MRSMLLSAVAAASLSLAAGSALAADIAPVEEPISVWYLGVFGGASWADVDNDEDHNDFELDTETGWTAGGVLGLNFAEHFRSEIEVSYADYNLDDCDGPGAVAPATTAALPPYMRSPTFGTISISVSLPVSLPMSAAASEQQCLISISRRKTTTSGVWLFRRALASDFGLGGPVTVDVGYRFKGIPDVGFFGSLDTELYFA